VNAGDGWLGPVAAAAALVFVAVTWRTRWRATGVLGALVMLGQAATLQLLQIDHYAGYTHLLPWTALMDAPRWALAILGAQTIVVLTLVWRSRRWNGWKFGTIPSWRMVLGGAVLAGALAVPTQGATRVALEWFLSLGLTALALLTLALVAKSADAHALGAAGAAMASRLTLEGPADAPPRRWDRAWPWCLAAVAVLVALVVGVFVLDGMPHIDDSISNAFQARYMSTGRLWLAAPPDSAAFHVDEVIVDGQRWFGYAFPGWPAVLAAGYAIGVPWLVNPLLAGAAVVLAFVLVRQLAGRATANLVAVGLAASPWLWFMGAEYMGHMASLVFMLVAAVLWQRVRRLDLQARRGTVPPGSHAGIVISAGGAGVALGWLLLTRPLDAALIGVGFAAAEIVSRDAVPRMRGWIAAAVTTGLVASLLPMYNRALTGSARLAPYRLWTDRTYGVGVDRLGFGPDIGIPVWRNIDPLPGHGIVDVVLNVNKNLYSLQSYLHGWMGGSLTLIIAAILWSRWTRRDAWPLAIVGSVALGYCAYWFPGGPALGPRYWFVAAPAFVWLTVRGGFALADHWRRSGVTYAGSRILLACSVATLAMIVTQVPWLAGERYHGFRDVSGDVRRLAESHAMEGALVFIRSDERADYQSAFNLNPPTLDSPATIYAHEGTAESRARVVARFPSRPVWVIGRAANAAPLAVLEGPLAPGSVPQ
jgi:hypothetical protein